MAERIGAFFDFDETLLDTESSRLGIQYLWQRRLVSRAFILKAFVAGTLYRYHLISDEQTAKILLRFYRNRRLDEFTDGSEDFYREILKPRLAPNILAKVHEHRDLGHSMVLISGSIRYMLEPVARDLGFEHLLCTDLEEDTNGFLTGKPKGSLCLDTTKRYLATKLAQSTGIDLQRSYAYGNHQADLPLLELVGLPHVVEPSRPLLKVAVARNWPILAYR
ncbi:Phosphoserine phosphatase (EC [Olavius sp. associated proteobacterium Delta 1]|nr:Phosphoserine phosphatase (EC [Olavius sp. associated proteobacterium Delta 1]